MTPRLASQEYLAAEVEAADPLHCIVLLHEGAARFTREAIRHIERQDFEGAHSAFVKAKSIVMHFLASIPEEDDGDLAANLRGLLRYAFSKLVEGNLRKDPQCAEEALQVLRTLGEGWATLELQRPASPEAPNPTGAAYLV